MFPATNTTGCVCNLLRRLLAAFCVALPCFALLVQQQGGMPGATPNRHGRNGNMRKALNLSRREERDQIKKWFTPEINDKYCDESGEMARAQASGYVRPPPVLLPHSTAGRSHRAFAATKEPSPPFSPSSYRCRPCPSLRSSSFLHSSSSSTCTWLRSVSI